MNPFANTTFSSEQRNSSELHSNISTTLQSNKDELSSTSVVSVETWKIILQLLLAFTGVLGNSVVTVVISRLRKKKSIQDIYIMNLAIADLGVLLLTFPLVAVKDKLPTNWPLGEFVCRYMYPVPEVFYGSSVWCIVLIAIERYRKIVKLKVTRRMKAKIAYFNRARILVCSMWLTSFIVFSLPLYFVVQYNEGNGIRSCGPVWPSWNQGIILRIYVCLLTAFSYIFPLVVITSTYITIANKLHGSSAFIWSMGFQNKSKSCPHNRQCSSRLSKTERQRLNQNERAKRLLTPIAVVFGITMLPLNTFRLTIAFWPKFASQDYVQTLYHIVSVCVILNSSANPVIYSLVSKDFRLEIRHLLFRDELNSVTGFSKTRSELCSTV